MMNEPSGMSETEHQPTYNIGDLVRWKGHTCTVAHRSGKVLEISLLNGDWRVVHESSVEAFPPHEQLIALASQLGAVEFNRWVADGMLCRRYISPDGSIDLTVRVP